ncbi:hypothetical protein ACA29_02850 [Lederbergia galactosidilytica]|uniref:Uncharacterized protein n=1 Tax=Lederbergia galactosidilytica TaxID=217031 RepID=A0A0Q9Y7N8_9BACI|nr:hypothetical protein ACA29_02850 [Lederbergia galactosidilytica]
MPKGALMLLPIGLAWLLADVGTESRSPIYFFRSFIGYQIRRLITKKTSYRGKEIPKEDNYQFRNYFTYTISEDEINTLETIEVSRSATVEETVQVTPKEQSKKKTLERWFGKVKVKRKKQKEEMVDEVFEPSIRPNTSMAASIKREPVEKKEISLEKRMENKIQEETKKKGSLSKAIPSILKPLNLTAKQRNEEKKKERVKREVFELLSLDAAVRDHQEKDLVGASSGKKRRRTKKKRGNI